MSVTHLLKLNPMPMGFVISPMLKIGNASKTRVHRTKAPDDKLNANTTDKPKRHLQTCDFWVGVLF